MEEVATEEKVETTSIGEALGEVSPKEEAAPVVEAPVVEAKVETPAVVVEEPSKQVPLNALTNERRKRQEAEAALAELRALQNEQPSLPYVDPDTHTLIQNQVGALGKQWENRHVMMSETIAKQAHHDYDEKYKAFESVAAANPELLNQIMQSDAPGEAAYQAGKQILFQQKYGSDSDTIIKRVKDELRPELEKEIQASLLGKLRDRNKQPTSTSQVRAASGETVADFRPTTFGDLLGR